jgi:hypothetical protein
MAWLRRAQNWLNAKPFRADIAAVLLLALLWLFFFWRVITPNPANQVSYPAGDFSGQFLAFSAYQARRLLAGEIPLWNPYNYGGHPFIADTQAAVFYPIRLIFIAISPLTGGWSYQILQIEAIFHYGLASLWMYLFIRAFTRLPAAGIVSAVVWAYGGYLTGYPPLQLAVLEAGIWLPLSLLGVYKAAGLPGGWSVRWLVLSALGLGISLLAGHPQTSLLYSYVLLAYLIYRAVRTRQRWWATLLAAGGVFLTGYSLAAIQLLPGLEYMRLTIRADFGFEELAHGFPFADLISFVLPNVVSLWSPLYSGITALVLAGIAIGRKAESAAFWAATGLIALGLSFGGATIFYRLAYLLAPGFSWFRGQERAAYGVAMALSVLAGLGTQALLDRPAASPRLRRILAATALTFVAVWVEIFVVSRFSPPDSDTLVSAAAFTAVLAVLCWLVFSWPGPAPTLPWLPVAVVGLITLDLFTTSWQTNWEPVPASERNLYAETLVKEAQSGAGLYRVDGRLGLGGNYGTMVGLHDIGGVSPLRLEALEAYNLLLPESRQWELLGVQYVFTDWVELPVPSSIVTSATMEGEANPWNLHRLDDPTPLAYMVYQIAVAVDDGQALGWLSEPAFNPRTTVILNAEPALSLPDAIPDNWEVNITTYEPERITLLVNTPADGILVVSEWDYPGWQVSVDGNPATIWRADAALRGIPLSAGTHTVTFTYRPATVWIGAASSILSLVTMAAGLVFSSRRVPLRGMEQPS